MLNFLYFSRLPCLGLAVLEAFHRSNMQNHAAKIEEFRETLDALWQTHPLTVLMLLRDLKHWRYLAMHLRWQPKLGVTSINLRLCSILTTGINLDHSETTPEAYAMISKDVFLVSSGVLLTKPLLACVVSGSIGSCNHERRYKTWKTMRDFLSLEVLRRTRTCSIFYKTSTTPLLTCIENDINTFLTIDISCWLSQHRFLEYLELHWLYAYALMRG